MDVIEVEVFNKLFASIAEEMGIILTRSSGRKGENLLIRRGKSGKIAGKTNLAAMPGDRLIIKTPGGGGWGRPG